MNPKYAKKQEADAKLLNLHKRYEFLNEVKRQRTRQGRFERDMLHLDHPIPGGVRVLEPSDRGRNAAEIYRHLENTPLWMILWKHTAAKLPRTGKRVLAALMEDWRTSFAARIAGVSRPTVDHWKKLFKKIFIQCFRAYERDFR